MGHKSFFAVNPGQKSGRTYYWYYIWFLAGHNGKLDTDSPGEISGESWKKMKGAQKLTV